MYIDVCGRTVIRATHAARRLAQGYLGFSAVSSYSLPSVGTSLGIVSLALDVCPVGRERRGGAIGG